MNYNYSYWEVSSYFSCYDVLIIGSGIVGLSAAIHLKKSNSLLKVGILEKGLLPDGASTKNAGFACFGSVSELLAQLKTSSEAELRAVVDMRWKGLMLLKELCGQELKFDPCGGFELFDIANKDEFETCKQQIPYLNKLLSDIVGSTDIYAVDTKKIPKNGFRNVEFCIRNNFEGTVDSGSMMLSLIKTAVSLGVIIMNGFDVNDFEQKENEIEVRSTKSDLFTTKKLLFATNAFTSVLLPEVKILPGRGQVMITKPINGLKVKGSFHVDKGYFYFRSVDNRILIGGGRNLDFLNEQTFEKGTSEIILSSLSKMLSEIILPNQTIEIDYTWSGIMGFGSELLPEIREARPNIFCAVRCNGMGVAMGSLSGKMAAEMMVKDLNYAL